MSSVSFHAIGLKPSLRRAAEKRAGDEGKNAVEYLRSLVERDVLAATPLDEILEPIRAGFKKSGVFRAFRERLAVPGRGRP